MVHTCNTVQFLTICWCLFYFMYIHVCALSQVCIIIHTFRLRIVYIYIYIIYIYTYNSISLYCFWLGQLFILCRQANLRYRELNDALETVQGKLRDARVSFTQLCACMFFVLTREIFLEKTFRIYCMYINGFVLMKFSLVFKSLCRWIARKALADRKRLRF